MPETGIGLFPDVGGSYFLPRCPGQIGMYLGLTGAQLKTADALYAGIATHFVPMQDWEALIELLARGDNPDDVMNTMAQAPGEASLAGIQSAIDDCFFGDSFEEILHALDARSDEWSRDTAAILRTKSPTSLKVAFRQIREGAKLGFDDCMKMEYRMVNRIVAGHDFYEGVRAVIIDKDNAPKWQPSDQADVSDADVAAYFAPMGANELKL
jgi:enoyl-CoA hydratase